MLMFIELRKKYEPMSALNKGGHRFHLLYKLDKPKKQTPR